MSNDLSPVEKLDRTWREYIRCLVPVFGSIWVLQDLMVNEPIYPLNMDEVLNELHGLRACIDNVHRFSRAIYEVRDSGQWLLTWDYFDDNEEKYRHALGRFVTCFHKEIWEKTSSGNLFCEIYLQLTKALDQLFRSFVLYRAGIRHYRREAFGDGPPGEELSDPSAAEITAEQAEAPASESDVTATISPQEPAEPARTAVVANRRVSPPVPPVDGQGWY